jgi:hypothetical protein
MWHPTKVHLNAANKKQWNIFLAKDISKDGAKSFVVFETFNDMMNTIKTTKRPNLYEIIPNEKTPVYLYFDLDRPKSLNEQLDDAMIINTFLDTLTTFLSKVYNIKIQFVIGENDAPLFCCALCAV